MPERLSAIQKPVEAVSSDQTALQDPRLQATAEITHRIGETHGVMQKLFAKDEEVTPKADTDVAFDLVHYRDQLINLHGLDPIEATETIDKLQATPSANVAAALGHLSHYLVKTSERPLADNNDKLRVTHVTKAAQKLGHAATRTFRMFGHDADAARVARLSK
jgi:hypothetical protein